MNFWPKFWKIDIYTTPFGPHATPPLRAVTHWGTNYPCMSISQRKFTIKISSLIHILHAGLSFQRNT